MYDNSVLIGVYSDVELLQLLSFTVTWKLVCYLVQIFYEHTGLSGASSPYTVACSWMLNWFSTFLQICSERLCTFNIVLDQPSRRYGT